MWFSPPEASAHAWAPTYPNSSYASTINLSSATPWRRFSATPASRGLSYRAWPGGSDQVVETYAKAYGIDKLHGIVTVGRTNKDSIANALAEVKGTAQDDDFILIHDGNRALVSQDIGSNALALAQRDQLCSSNATHDVLAD